MSPTIVRDFHTELIETIRDASRYNKWWSSPLNLGGVAGTSGGMGAPVGGIFGQLIQTKIAYDTSEDAYSGIMTNAPSGSLVDNLGHIRYRLETLEDNVLVYENLMTQISGTNHFTITDIAINSYFGVYLNGIRQDETRYTIDADWQGFITTFTPISGDELYAQYNK